MGCKEDVIKNKLKANVELITYLWNFTF
jgi:hypothetical protein